MRTAIKQRRFVRDTYMDLVQAFPLRPIRTLAQYHAASKVLDQLVLRDNLDSGEEDYLEILEDLLDAYDDAKGNLTTDQNTPLQCLLMLVEQSQMSAKELAELLEISRAMVSMILAGKREISKPIAKKLAERFRVSVDCFI